LFFNLGHGNFGSVMKGTYILSASKKIPIAVKTLKEEDIPGQKVWLTVRQPLMCLGTILRSYHSIAAIR